MAMDYNAENYIFARHVPIGELGPDRTTISPGNQANLTDGRQLVCGARRVIDTDNFAAITNFQKSRGVYYSATQQVWW